MKKNIVKLSKLIVTNPWSGKPITVVSKDKFDHNSDHNSGGKFDHNSDNKSLIDMIVDNFFPNDSNIK